MNIPMYWRHPDSTGMSALTPYPPSMFLPIWLFIWILYNKRVITSVLLSWVLRGILTNFWSCRGHANPSTCRQPDRSVGLFCCYCSVAPLCLTLCGSRDCRTPGFPVLHHLPESAQTHVHWVSDAIQSSYPLLPLLFLPSIFPSIRVSFNESSLRIRWPKYWSFSISPSNEYSGLKFFRIDLFDLLAVQGTVKSLLQQHSLNASILWWSAFFMV